MNAHIAKPIDIDTVQNTLAKFIKISNKYKPDAIASGFKI